MPQLRTNFGAPDVARGGRASSTVVERVRVIGGQVLRLQLGDEIVFASADASSIRWRPWPVRQVGRMRQQSVDQTSRWTR